jgi:outer membrane receptor protein involved in Fe transport
MLRTRLLLENFLTLCCGIALTLPWATAVLAQEAPAPGAAIVVTGRGLDEAPAAPAYDVTTIDPQQMSVSASGRLEDVLSDAAGFQQYRRSDSRSANPSAQGVTLRALGGNATSRTLVLLDGVPMADPMFGYIPFTAIAPERLGQIRVIRGGGAGAFGAGAVAGTIEMTSADPATLGLFSGQTLVDERGETELTGTVAPRLGEGFAVVSGRWDRGEGFWTTPVDQRVPASVRAAYESWSTSARAVFPVAPDVELQARGMLFGDQRVLRFEGANSTSSGEDASLRLVGRGEWQFDALAYLQARNFSNIVISATTYQKTLDQRRTPSTGIGGKFELRPPVGGNHVLRLGTDLRIAEGELQEEPYSKGAVTARRRAGGRNNDLGLFAEDDWTLGALVLTAGARADYWSILDGHFRQTTPDGVVTTAEQFPDRSGWDGSFRGGAVLKLGAGFSLRGSAYEGLRLPTLNELYRPFVVFPVTTLANAGLRNEELRGYEAGLDFTAAAWLSLSATAFDNRVKHAIANVTIATNLQQRENIGAIHARGLEFGATVSRGAVSFNGSLALTDAKVDASGAAAQLDGLRPAQTPQVAGSATLAWRPHKGWQFAATVSHTGAQYEDDLNQYVLPAATTLDGFVEVPLAKVFSLILRAENLTDATVETRNQAGSIDLGAPRTLWVGVKVGGL